MVQSIELLFDAATEASLLTAWATLAEAGLPSLATIHSSSHRPHVTAAVAETGLEAATSAVRRLLERRRLRSGLDVLVGAPLLFGGHRRRWVLTRQIVTSPALLDLHAELHALLTAAAPHEQTVPGGWTPHVSLARRVPAERLGEALTVLDVEPIHARFLGARLWDSGPKTVTRLA